MTEKQVHEWSNAGCVIHGDCLEVLRAMEDSSVDAIITDPPAGISFMGKEWDNFGGKKHRSRQDEKQNAEDTGKWLEGRGTLPYSFSPSAGRTRAERDAFVAFMTEVMQEALRVLKPGGHALVWSLPRTSHWTACALEDAGFEIRDNIYHIFGSGFPKSLDVSKALDKRAGAERQVVGIRKQQGNGGSPRASSQFIDAGGGKTADNRNSSYAQAYIEKETFEITAPATPAAQQFAGYGTALKPSVETWWLCRKPLAAKSVADNVLQFGTGAINIDACRIPGIRPAVPQADFHAYDGSMMTANERESYRNGKISEPHTSGRFPSHLLLSHTLLCTEEQCEPGCPVAALDEQSGIRPPGYRKNPSIKRDQHQNTTYGKYQDTYTVGERGYSDQGGASRYFATFRPDVPFIYSAKASRRERNEGCEALPVNDDSRRNLNYINWIVDPRHPNGGYEASVSPPLQNNHPTVKPQQLMRYLVRLITPPDGVVLDCFGGSGSTALACIAENKRFVLIERESEYVEIARARISYALEQEKQKECSA